MKKAVRFAILAITAILLCAIAYAQQQPPAQIPLGDLVKQQRAARKAKKVVTNDDMPARPPETAPAVGAIAIAREGQATGAAAKSAEARAAVPDVATGEQARQDKIRNLRESEEAAKKIISQMEEELADPNLSDNRRRMYGDTLRLSREQLDKFTREREALEQQGTAPKPPGTATPQEQ